MFAAAELCSLTMSSAQDHRIMMPSILLEQKMQCVSIKYEYSLGMVFESATLQEIVSFFVDLETNNFFLLDLVN